MLNKYYPPDFDPAKLPRGKRPDHNSMKVRMMLPMSVQCKTCGTFMYKGTKFNMKKEDVDGETYLGIQIFRFYWRCSACAAEITMMTDPKNADYNMELGATRNYEPWREKDKAVALSKAQREEEERGNAMKVRMCLAPYVGFEKAAHVQRCTQRDCSASPLMFMWQRAAWLPLYSLIGVICSLLAALAECAASAVMLSNSPPVSRMTRPGSQTSSSFTHATYAWQ